MRDIRATLAYTRQRLIAFGFELLYNELAWLYDPVSWIVSRGLWRRWQKTAWSYLPPEGRILDAGCGPGHLLADLAAGGYQPVGFDLSPAMLGLTRRRLLRKGVVAPLCRGLAQALPFAPQSFAAVVSSFPTAYVYDPDWIRQVYHILQSGGRLIVVEMVSFPEKAPRSRFLEWLYRVTGQRSPAPDLLRLLEAENLSAWRESVEVDGSSVGLIMASKR